MSESRWRTGRKLGRTLYLDEACVGMVDSAAIASEIVAAMNAIEAAEAPSDDPAFLEAHVAEDTRQWKAHADAAYARGLASGERALAEERKKSSELRAALQGLDADERLGCIFATAGGPCIMPLCSGCAALAVLDRYPTRKP
jgi:hypothetical protein